LVSRHFIEILKGDQIVSHLIQFGTPNNGSPLPHAHAYLTMGLTYAINGLVATFPMAMPLLAINWFNKGTKVALTNMQSGSKYLARLNEYRPRTTPYSMVNGNTRFILPDPTDDEAWEAEVRFLERIFRRFNRNSLMDLAFFRAPNDIAVSVESQQTIPGEGKFDRVEVACDHMSYFVSPAGVKGLEVLLPRIFEETKSD